MLPVRLLLKVVVPSSVVVPEELELLEELLLEELELLSELALLEELLEEEPPLLLPLEELAPPLLEPPPPPQAVSIETAMTAARAAAATFFDNLMIEFLPFFDFSKTKTPNVIVWYANLTPPPATLSSESNNFVSFFKNLHFTWCNMTISHLAGNTKGPPNGRP